MGKPSCLAETPSAFFICLHLRHVVTMHSLCSERSQANAAFASTSPRRGGKYSDKVNFVRRESIAVQPSRPADDHYSPFTAAMTTTKPPNAVTVQEKKSAPTSSVSNGKIQSFFTPAPVRAAATRAPLQPTQITQLAKSLPKVEYAKPSAPIKLAAGTKRLGMGRGAMGYQPPGAKRLK